MSAEKPLHVQVAEALGITVILDDTLGYCHIPDERTFKLEPVPNYDTDWSATGPLIERLEISLDRPGDRGEQSIPWTAWACGKYDKNLHGLCRSGPTPLIAVCELILALARAGKLLP